jgi:hypothetical protein
MWKKVFNILLFVIAIILSISCTKKDVNRAQFKPETGVYSNLLDEDSRKEVQEALERSGIPTSDIESFFEQVDYFNRSINEYGLVKNGFKEKLKLEPDYDPYKMQDLWNEKNPEFLGYNCRITSYSLMKNLIEVGEFEKEDSNILIFDEDSIQNGPDNIFNQS